MAYNESYIKCKATTGYSVLHKGKIRKYYMYHNCSIKWKQHMIVLNYCVVKFVTIIKWFIVNFTIHELLFKKYQ